MPRDRNHEAFQSSGLVRPNITTLAARRCSSCRASGNTIYGYYSVGATSGTLAWAQRFADAEILINGVQLSLLPKFTLASES